MVLGGKAGGNLGVAIGDGLAGETGMNAMNPPTIRGYSTGGITPYSGTFLVGERGPGWFHCFSNSRCLIPQILQK